MYFCSFCALSNVFLCINEYNIYLPIAVCHTRGFVCRPSLTLGGLFPEIMEEVEESVPASCVHIWFVSCPRQM